MGWAPPSQRSMALGFVPTEVPLMVPPSHVLQPMLRLENSIGCVNEHKKGQTGCCYILCADCYDSVYPSMPEDSIDDVADEFGA